MNKTGCFAVTKGVDICIVYYSIKCLLNADLCCPSFYLLYIYSILNNAD